MSDNIIGFNKPATVAPVEQTYDYELVTLDGGTQIAHGHLSFNPLFAAVVDADEKLIFAVPMAQLRTIRRQEPRPAFNA